jgi:hypothetical protein
MAETTEGRKVHRKSRVSGARSPGEGPHCLDGREIGKELVVDGVFRGGIVDAGQKSGLPIVKCLLGMLHHIFWGGIKRMLYNTTF